MPETRYSDDELDALRAAYAAAKQRADKLSALLRADGREDYDAIYDQWKAASDEATRLHWPIFREQQLRAGEAWERDHSQTLPDTGHYPDLVGEPEHLRGASDPVPQSAPSGFKHYVYDNGRVHLFQRVVNGRVVSGLTVVAKRARKGKQSATIDRVNTVPGHRRKGYARELLSYARSIMRKVKHSKQLTGDGKAWKRSVNPGDPKRRKNPDDRFRDLERLAKQGDREAAVRLLVERVRLGLPLIKVMAAADLGCSEAEEAYEAIMGRKLTKVSYTDQIAQAFTELPEVTIYDVLLDLAREIIQISRGPFAVDYLLGIERLERLLFATPRKEEAIHVLATEIIQINPGNLMGIALYTLAYNRINYPIGRGGLDALVMSSLDFTNYLQGESRAQAKQWLRERLIHELLA